MTSSGSGWELPEKGFLWIEENIPFRIQLMVKLACGIIQTKSRIPFPMITHLS